MTKPNKEKLLSTAFPATPAVDNYNRLFTPFPGMTRIEYYVLQIFCFRHNETNVRLNKDKVMPDGKKYEPITASIYDAEKLISRIDAYIESLEETKSSTLTIL